MPMIDDENEDYPLHKKLLEEKLTAKATEIFEIVHTLTEDMPDSSGTKHLKQFMAQDSHTIRVKLAGATGDTLYSIKMENAALIRKAAMSLYISKHGLYEEGYNGMHYFDMLRGVIDEFRELFIDWVDSFDQWNYINDEWNLFNPPGVHARDKNPDKDLPFDNPLNPDTDED